MSNDKQVVNQQVLTAPPPYSVHPTAPPIGFQIPVQSGGQTNPPDYYGVPPQQQMYYQSPPPQEVQPQTVQPNVVRNTIITINTGGCPSCRVGVLEDSFTCCGICCAIFCFPIGIICCLCMKEKRCNKCGATF